MNFGPFPIIFNVPDLQRRPYKYSVRNADGSFYAFLTNVYNSKLVQEVNKPSELSFSIPYSEEVSSFIVGRSEIWLHDKDDNTLGIFRVHKRKDTNENIAIINLTCYDSLALLVKDTTSDYDTSGNKSVDGIVDDILALQTDDNPITKGTINSNVSSTQKTVLVSTPTSLFIWSLIVKK